MKWNDMVMAVNGRVGDSCALVDGVRDEGDCFFHSCLFVIHFKGVRFADVSSSIPQATTEGHSTQTQSAASAVEPVERRWKEDGAQASATEVEIAIHPCPPHIVCNVYTHTEARLFHMLSVRCLDLLFEI